MNKLIDNVVSHNRRHYQRGMSLVELMVAITLGIFLIWGVTQSFLTSKQIYLLQQGMAGVQENGRLAQEFLGYDIRNAGDYGCGDGDYFLNGSSTVAPDARNDATCTGSSTLGMGTGKNEIQAITALDEEFEYAVYGFDNVAASTTLTATTPAGGSVTATLSMTPKAGTDVLMVHVPTDVGVVASATGTPSVGTNGLGIIAASPTLTVFSAFTLNTAAKFVNSTVQKDRLAVSDCANTRIYGVQNMTTASTTLTLADNFCTTGVFAQNPTARMIDTVYYFVAANGRGGYSLYRQTGGYSTSAAQELLEGVEDLQLTYGIDASPTPNDFVVDWYKAAGDTSGNIPTSAAGWVSAWDGWDWDSANNRRENTLVRAVRYSILVRTINDSVVQDYQTYSFNGSAVTSTDHRLREVFSGTVGIRSRSL
jgi:type IV pilus assembly protein PilW